MLTLSTVDPTAPIACTLPPGAFIDRLRALEDIVGDRLRGVRRTSDSITFELRATHSGLEGRIIDWAEEEKDCCAFLGFSIERTGDAIALTIEAPAGAEAVLDGIDWTVRASGRRSA